ncbi:membrane protein [Nitrospira sp. KM1]|uniref:DUF2127 domain-containing protein n=1 Tax=Nitrospira sp. KM1 TaxID=1936990 RepID=UPI0013A78800|nr:DUF2127 domain-containing protein [Nitrospira sp. KM1]BCA53603.1 membrane protein [Nitrospira sp. KM1]
MNSSRSHNAGLAIIAIFRLIKGVALLILAFGLLRMVHADIAAQFASLMEVLHLNGDSRILHALVLRVDALQPHTVLMAGVVSFIYATVLLIEGTGLWLEAWWAAYMTVVSTGLLIPFELYEIMERATTFRIVLLLVNIAVVVYLVHHVRRTVSMTEARANAPAG